MLPLLLTAALGADVKTGVAVMRPSDAAGLGNVRGTVTFRTLNAADTEVVVALSGLVPNSEHGFHVHQYGDMDETKTFASSGLHFIPICTTADPVAPGGTPGASACLKDQVHGIPPSENRQPGDMGNLIADANGDIATTLTLGQTKMDLSSSLRSVIGRVVVLHERRDDGNPKTTGNAGNPVAMGVIGRAAPSAGNTNSAMAPNTPAPDKVACVFDASSTAENAGVFGTVVLQTTGTFSKTALLKAKLHGLAAGTFSWHFHAQGDITGTGFANVGEIFTPTDATVKLGTISGAGATSPTYFEGLFTVDELRSHVGASLTIHSGPTSASSTIAAAVCGLAHPDTTVVVPGGIASGAARVAVARGTAAALALAALAGLVLC